MKRKVLIISSSAPPGISGATHMMYQLFRYFPEDSFVFLTSHAGINDHAREKGFVLNTKYFYFDTPKLTTALNKDTSSFQKAKSIIKKNIVLLYLADLASFFYFTFNIVRYGRKIIAEEKIDVLLAYSSNGVPFFSGYLLSIITKKPLCLYFYDLYIGNKLSLNHKVFAFFIEPLIFKKAEKVFVMCEKLKEHYQQKYQREVIVINNSIPIPTEKNPSGTLNRQKIHKMLYTGSIYWAQANAIKNVILAIEALHDMNVQLWIYTTTTTAHLHAQGIFESKKVFFAHGDPLAMTNLQRDADILFIPLSFNTNYPLLINTSIPAKTCEYLISGRPILVHAPLDSYISEYAKKYDFALVVDQPNIEKLKESITTLLTDDKTVARLTENAFKTAALNHDAKKNSKLFQSYLIGVS